MLGFVHTSTDPIIVIHGLISHIHFCVTLSTCAWLTVVVALCTCSRGKVIGCVVIVVVIADTKITKSGDLGI